MKKVLIVLFAVTVAVSLTLKATRSPQQVVLPPGESSTIARGRMGEPPGLVATQTVDRSSAGLATAAQLANGAKIYRTLCVSCHLPDGKGMLTAVPPLAGSDYMLADRARTIRGVLKGVSGPITVNQVTYNAVMPPLEAVQ
jgi:mono/diheme cytochrome c family protein